MCSREAARVQAEAGSDMGRESGDSRQALDATKVGGYASSKVKSSASDFRVDKPRRSDSRCADGKPPLGHRTVYSA